MEEIDHSHISNNNIYVAILDDIPCMKELDHSLSVIKTYISLYLMTYLVWKELDHFDISNNNIYVPILDDIPCMEELDHSISVIITYMLLYLMMYLV